MEASVWNNHRAIEMSAFIVQAFVKLRQVTVGHQELANKLSQSEHRLAQHDESILSLVKAIKQLMSPSTVLKKRRICF